MPERRTSGTRDKRPAGTVAAPRGTRLTDDQKRLILTATEAGATDYIAAQVAGISTRTFRELRQRAEGRHPTRRSTPELKAFFEQVDEALARARMKREIEIADRDPKHWLKHQAPSKPGFDGWTAPVPEPIEAGERIEPASREELAEVVAALIAAGAVASPPCGDRGCPCTHHRAAGARDDRVS